MYAYQIIYVFKSGFIKHLMLRLPSGMVIHNAPFKNIKVEPLEAAASGRNVHIKKAIWLPYSEQDLVMKASQLAQKKSYVGLGYNCHDFLEELTGVKIEDNQVNMALGLAALTAGLFVLARQ